MKAVRGAVKNTADAHPEWRIDRRFAGSVAKRAAGTLTAEWPEVLAARLARRQERVAAGAVRRRPRRVGVLPRPSSHPLKSLWRELSRKAGAAKRAGRAEVAAGLVEALRLVARAQQMETGD